MSCKITLIGAGSVVFAKTLIGDILQFPETSDGIICLMDIDPDRLKVADEMMKKMAAKLGVSARIESTLDRRSAIRGAKYVICTIQVGGFKPSTVRDFEIPKKYGLQQTIGDTLGVGGIFRGLRTIPVLVEIAREIADVGHPDCLFLNYTNPMAMNCWAVHEATGIPHVGLCHSIFGTARMLASHAGLPFEDISYLVAGVNHMAFFLKLQCRGQDIYPMLFRVLEDPDRTYERVRYEMMRRTGFFVTESSEHQAEYTPYFIHHGDEIIEKFDIPIDEYLRRCESIMSIWDSTEAELIGENGEIDLQPQSEEYGSYIIHSLETNTPRTIYGNVPNVGLIDNLESGCCVEVPCLIDGSGLHPVKIGRLPSQLAALCNTNINVQRLTVDAALTGKREHIYHAAMLDPHTSATLTCDRIWSLCDDLIEAHQKDGFLGDFSPVIRNTGRSYAGIGDRVIARVVPRGLKLDEAQSRFHLDVKVENPGEEDLSIKLELATQSDAISFENKTVEMAVRAGETADTHVTGTVERAGSDSIRIDLRTSNPRVLCIAAILMPRRRLEKDWAEEATFEMHLSGFLCATGNLRRDGESLVIKIRVNDSDPRIRTDYPWMGSCIELFFSDEAHPAVTQVFVIPGEGNDARVLTPAMRSVAGAKLDVKRSKSGYDLKLDLPCKAAGLQSQGSFLFDCYATLNALGDAHSGGRSSLSGKFESKEDMSYALEASV